MERATHIGTFPYARARLQAPRWGRDEGAVRIVALSGAAPTMPPGIVEILQWKEIPGHAPLWGMTRYLL